MAKNIPTSSHPFRNCGFRFSFNNFLFKLDKVNLSGANLRNSKIDTGYWYAHNLNLSNADLEGSVFKNGLLDANLSNAKLQNVVFAEVRGIKSFEGADLEGVIFKKTKLDGVSFVGAVNIPDWVKSGLSRDKIYRQKIFVEALNRGEIRDSGSIFLEKGQGVEIDFETTEWRGVQFWNEIICDKKVPSWLTGGLDEEGYFQEQKLVDNLNSKNFPNINPDGAKFSEVEKLPEWVKKGLDDKNIFRQKILVEKIKEGEQIEWEYVNLVGADLSGFDFSGVSCLKLINFEGANLKDCNFSGLTLDNCSFEHVFLEGVDFNETNFPYLSIDSQYIQKGIGSDGIYRRNNVLEKIRSGEDIWFYQMDLRVANLEGIDVSCLILLDNQKFCYLEGARFEDAKNIPNKISRKLDRKGIFHCEEAVA